jgi:hypothetical protein
VHPLPEDFVEHKSLVVCNADELTVA